MLWVHKHYKYFNTFSVGIIFIRQSTYKDAPHAEIVNDRESLGYSMCFNIFLLHNFKSEKNYFDFFKFLVIVKKYIL